MNKRLMRTLLPIATAVLGMGAVASAQATLTINLATEFSGGTVADNTYTATFDDTACGSDCVRLTMATTGTSTTEFIAGGNGNFGWGFNFDPNLASDLGNLTFTPVTTGPNAGTNNADYWAIGENAFKADGDGYFDILFGWPTNSFMLPQTSVFDITGVSGLNEDFFNFKSQCGQGCGNGGWTSAAHVQAIGQAGGSGWMGGIGISSSDIPPPTIPEPGTLALFASAMLGWWGTRRRMR